MYTRDFGPSRQDGEKIPPGYSGSAFTEDRELAGDLPTGEGEEEAVATPASAITRKENQVGLLSRCREWLSRPRFRDLLNVDTLILVVSVWLLLDDRGEDDLLLILLLCFFSK